MHIERLFSTTGLLTGTLFFALSLTPSLLPRGDMVQGVISGLSSAAGYGVGVFGLWLWSYFELPTPGVRVQRFLKIAVSVLCGLFAAAFLWRASHWQNSLRALMGMEEMPGSSFLLLGIVALLVFIAVLKLARLFRCTWQFLSRRLERFVPRRVSRLVGLAAAVVLFWSIVDGVLFSFALRSADASYREIDARMEPEMGAPADPLKTGSAQSLLAWQDMGRQGRRFLSGAPTREQIAAYADGPISEPVRVYVGLNAADTPEERAHLALEEMIRVGAFERSLLVLITPTGTGWVDPGGIEPLEYLHRGDVASVAAQYSYLPSPLALMSEGAYGVEMAQALFQAVYGHWTAMPKEARPRLYLHGLSLGALNSDRSFDLYDIIDDPFQGALWSGPPFRSDTWRTVTQRRAAGSPAWLPRFRDGSVIRFANQNGGLEVGKADWGAFRIAYLQYASDPITFFEPESLYREPDWMKSPRGPDVSPDLRWFPIVTMLQLAADMATGSSPVGYGHNFAAVDYLDAWLALTEPQGWSEEELARLRRFFEDED